MENFLNNIDILNVSSEEIRMLNPLVLAYIGDSVFDLFIKSYIVSKSRANVNKINKMVVSFVKAKSQSIIINSLFEELTEEEKKIVKRGRNTKSYTSAKNASLVDYKLATGFEALIGFLYLSRDNERLNEIIEFSINIIENMEREKK